MRLIFIIGLILWGWIEISAFIFVGGEIGVLLTIIGVFVTAIAGLSLLKSQGRAVMVNLQEQVRRGEAPLKSVADSLSLLLGGILMLIPGYVTDAIGLMLFLPGIRTVTGFSLMAMLQKNARFQHFANQNTAAHQTHKHQPADDDIIEGEYEEKPAKPGSIPPYDR